MQAMDQNYFSVKNEQLVKVVREGMIAQNTVFVGGVPGSGKSMLSPILGSLDRVEIQKYNYTIEYMCSLVFLGRMDQDLASVLIRTLVDYDLYNMMMSRETNFRFKDLSSIFKNPRPWRYIRRLFNPGDAEVMKRIQQEKPILQIFLHNLLLCGLPLARSLNTQFCFIELVRHPLYMLKPWFLYIERYGKDLSDFTIWFEHQGHSLPFFAYGWEEKYIHAKPMDKVIYSIEHCISDCEKTLQQMTETEKSRVILVPFEKFVIDPWPFLRKVETVVGTKVTPATLRELKKQHVPRKMFGDGLDLPVYRANGWESPEKGGDERKELERKREYAAQHASAEAMKVLDRISWQYEQKWQIL